MVVDNAFCLLSLLILKLDFLVTELKTDLLHAENMSVIESDVGRGILATLVATTFGFLSWGT